jgi:hypothetical protein
MKHCRNMRELLRSLGVQESRAEILATPNYPRVPPHATDVLHWPVRDVAAENAMNGAGDAG